MNKEKLSKKDIDIDWQYFYGKIECNFFSYDVLDKIMDGYDFGNSIQDMEMVEDIIKRHKNKI
ncbi:MAG: hypothetical protein ACTTKD_09735 [Peptoanaerobacter stomatis]|uniref:hypothetical protein n=1 Tax=Peptoanaerobacter stomatis TaxID=796937 RepID=UPI003FA0F7E5